ncbi:hypothetical protein [Oxynema aestuarii]|jgi:hypothetical protein|uniref:Uncharacterized protein n=1 Tax=Oxynema aestuarii AP17 TaxID=2064643 RepID=A0A6H1TZD4_9CYAN|nr:hypothetical protein [Oxynema aestuarii]QIZ71133.1 hypothetical protein HCG48_11560 [Oxynema aestuarii AP17]RMH76923.1 MAG: hypothetical protein D6680_06855 [Cyanobacteria bacterium J007]
MQLSSYMPQIPLEELYGQIMFSNVVTPTDRQQLRAALLKECLSEDEKAIVDRILYNVRRGWLQMVE